MTNNATGVVSTRQTNDSGDYEVPSLRVGQYNIEVTKGGFAAARATDITVSVGGRQRIDLTLQIGETNTTVEVSGVSLQVETDSSQRRQMVTQYQSAALPLVSRNYSDLLGLVTGVRQAPTAATTSSISSLVRAGAYNVNGQRSMFNNFLLDGMDNNAYGESNQGFDNQIISVPPDSVVQFSVVTNNQSAEYGRSSGATINVGVGGRNKQVSRHGVRVHPQHQPECRRILQTEYRQQQRHRRSLQEAHVQSQPVRREFRRSDPEGQVVLLPRLRRLPAGAEASERSYSADSERTQRHPCRTGEESRRPAQLMRPAQRFPRIAINPLSAADYIYFKQIPGLPVWRSRLRQRGFASNDYAVQVPFTDYSDKGDLRLD